MDTELKAPRKLSELKAPAKLSILTGFDCPTLFFALTTHSHSILRFADTAAILLLPPGHPIMIIELNIFLSEQLISMFIMGCSGDKINMAAISAKQSMEQNRKKNSKLT